MSPQLPMKPNWASRVLSQGPKWVCEGALNSEDWVTRASGPGPCKTAENACLKATRAGSPGGNFPVSTKAVVGSKFHKAESGPIKRCRTLSWQSHWD